MNRELSADDVWHLMAEGCNCREIAAFAGVSLATATAMMANAARYYAHAA